MRNANEKKAYLKASHGFFCALLIVLSGCVATNGTTTKKVSSSGNNNGTSTLINTTYDSYTINNVTISASGSAGAFSTLISLVSSSSTNNLANDCPAVSSATTTSSCTCQFNWTETNTTSGSPITIQRQVNTNITSVRAVGTAGTIGCLAPSVYGTEIIDGTSLSVTIAPPTGSTTQAQFNIWTYVVNANGSSTPSNFTDSTGTPFANIARYTCYNQAQRGMSIQNTPGSILDPNTSSSGNNLGTASFPIGSQFCIRKYDGTIAGNSTACTSSFVSPASYSSQSYYFNLYIQENAEGNINLGNAGFTCPQVKEALNQAPGNLGTQGKPWPLDKTFALSQSYTTNYNIGVAANMITSNGSDATSQAVTCAQMQANSTSTASPTPAPSSSSGSSSNNSLISSCMGFAAPAAANGSCGKINGLQTYRLRRYYVIYPPVFNTDGCPLSDPSGCKGASGSAASPSQLIDTIYVEDRPVSSASDPSAVIEMLGPKPCPAAFFDHAAVTGAKGYYATGNALWTGKNIDGIQFPNTDGVSSNGVQSCSATLPIVNAGQTAMSVTTINASNPIGLGDFPSDSTRSLKAIYVRPVQAWSPHYVEDTSFQACAPLAQPLQDPPMHFAKLTANNNALTWCAEVYPSQNDNVSSLDPNVTGLIAPYTSHAPQGTGVGCSLQLTNHGITSLPVGYPAAGLANHTGAGANTCDRTVSNPAGGLSFKNFPLMAPATDVEKMLKTDSSYGCTISFYNGNTATQNSPTQGCCGTNVSVVPGNGGSATAHLEPPLAPAKTNCLVPEY